MARKHEGPGPVGSLSNPRVDRTEPLPIAVIPADAGAMVCIRGPFASIALGGSCGTGEVLKRADVGEIVWGQMERSGQFEAVAPVPAED